MRFYLELADNRIKLVGEKLQSFGKEILDYEYNMQSVTSDDIVILSPAHKLNSMEIKCLNNCRLLIAGNASDELLCEHINVLKDEKFGIENSILTAENFLPPLIMETKKSIYSQKILITGSGKVAQSLWSLFGKMGIKFTATMRDEKQLLLSKIFAENSFCLSDISSHAKDFDTIINTVPTKLFDNNIVLKDDCVFFELSSLRSIDEDLPAKYIACPALPAKYAPDTAGEMLWRVVRECLAKFSVI